MMIVRAVDPSRELTRWALERNPLDAGLWAQAADVELHAGNLSEAERLLTTATQVGAEHRYVDEVRLRLLIATGRAEEVLAVEVPRLAGTRLATLARAYALAELGRETEVRALLEDEEHVAALNATHCWLLARIGDQGAANACAAAFDAAPQGWVQLSRMIVYERSVPFDPESAPRFTAAFRASGAPPWPRTEPVPPATRPTAR
jgi:hypothetical protein